MPFVTNTTLVNDFGDESIWFLEQEVINVCQTVLYGL